MFSLIEAQNAYIARVAAADRKQGPRSAGLMFARTKRAARRELTETLIARGCSEKQAASAVNDAQAMFILRKLAND